MSFPRYPKYKDSGVEWLGEVPEHWIRTNTKHVVNFTTGWTPPTGDDSSYAGDNLWANISDLGPKVICNTAKRVSDGAVRAARAIPSPPGSLLFSFKLSIGEVSFAGKSMYTNEAIATFVPSSAMSLRFAYYALPFYLVRNAGENIYGAKLLNQELIRSAPLAVPPLAEQETIATVLDCEAGKIDGLIAEQRRLIELLEEKRQAVISHAVSDGLNPSAPTKPSTVGWRGTIPAHWTTVSLKHVTALIVDCPHETPTYSDDGNYFVVRTADMERGTLDNSRMFRIDSSEYLKRIRRAPLLRGDIVYGREGERWGHAAIVPQADRYCLGQRMMQIRAANDILPEYLMWALNSDATYRQGLQDTVGATSPHVNVETIRNYWLAVPPADEQRGIAAHLETVTDRLDVAIAEAQLAIELLTERRAALISAAVTGKIDVRNYAADQAEAA